MFRIDNTQWTWRYLLYHGGRRILLNQIFTMHEHIGFTETFFFNVLDFKVFLHILSVASTAFIIVLRWRWSIISVILEMSKLRLRAEFLFHGDWCRNGENPDLTQNTGILQPCSVVPFLFCLLSQNLQLENSLTSFFFILTLYSTVYKAFSFHSKPVLETQWLYM